MRHPMADPARSKDLCILIQANEANINGNPADGGVPRVDVDGYGILSAQAYKRKVRDFVAAFHDALLAVPQGGFKSEIRKGVIDTAEAKEAAARKAAGLGVKPKAGEERLTPWDSELYNESYWDQRVMGGIPMKFKGPKAYGHGPFHLNAQNLTAAHVDVVTMDITCAAGEKPDKDKDGNDKGGLRANMGSVALVKHGLYVVRGSYDATRGMRNKVSEKDLEILFDGLFACWDHSQSASRTNVHVVGAFVAVHPGARRSENTLVAGRRVSVTVKDSTEPPRSQADYVIEYDQDNAPEGMSFFQFDDTVNGFTP